EASSALVPLLLLCDGPNAQPATRDGLITESRSERGGPGEGEFDLPAMLASFTESTPVSVEPPSDARVAAMGELAWDKHLKAAANSVLTTPALIW
ncbi:sugar phosphate isomerase/epimerase, partial [Paenarthrobacter aurescens]|nr:sugar phosphate isomerase/epimerase [Paenarthrobacter aurescens]